MRISLRFEVFKRDAFTCRYCGKKSPEAILEVDHVVPVSSGGSDDLDNLVTACYACNRGKGARLLTDLPPEENLHEKAILIAEQELQIKELTYWRMQQRQREEKEIATIKELFWGAYPYLTTGGIKSFFKEARIRSFIRQLGFVEVLETAEYAIEHATRWDGKSIYESAWIYFCAMCTKKHGQPKEGERHA